MAGKKHKKSKDDVLASTVKDGAQAFLDDVLRQACAHEQFDSFFEKKAAELLALESNCLPAVTRRFQKATSCERDALLKLLKYFTGFQHIQYLQDVIAREALLPRHGMLMLDIFNRSDVMLESGLASRLLDLDSLVQRIKQSIEGNAADSQACGEFLQCSAHEQEGIISQLIEEKGAGLGRFIAALFSADEQAAARVVQSVSQYQGREAFVILEDLYQRTGRKDIDKIRKKSARTLKQKGIDVSLQEVRKPAASVFKQAGLPPGRTFISGVDAEGFRLVFMIKPLSQYESKLFNVIIQYARGIHDIEVVTLFRRELNAWIEKLQSDEKMTVAEVENEYGAFLVDEAVRLSESRGAIVSTNIAQWRKHYGGIIGKMKRPKIYAVIPEPGAKNAVIGDGALAELFSCADIHYWYAITPEARQQWDKACGVSENPDAVTGEYTEEALRAAVDEFFTPARRQEFNRRIEEQAYMLHHQGHADAARTALSVAITLLDETAAPSDNGLCREIVRRGFDAFAESYREYRRRSGPAAANHS